MVKVSAKAISNSFTQIHTGITAGERILALIDEKPAIADRPGAVVLKDFKDGLELRNVSFAYGTSEVLHHINLDITKGKTVALVGPSGGWKKYADGPGTTFYRAITWKRLPRRKRHQGLYDSFASRYDGHCRAGIYFVQ